MKGNNHGSDSRGMNHRHENDNRRDIDLIGHQSGWETSFQGHQKRSCYWDEESDDKKIPQGFIVRDIWMIHIRLDYA